MKTLIIYDSVFGNTSKIAQAMFQGLPIENLGDCKHVQEVDWKDLKKYDLLLIGSPTRGFRPTPSITKLLKNLSKEELASCNAAAFDTRFDLKELKTKAFRFIVNSGGYAAKKISRMLKSKGANIICPPEGFLVSGESGPLKEKELDRAMHWSHKICKQTNSLT
jgi:flavodoxin